MWFDASFTLLKFSLQTPFFPPPPKKRKKRRKKKQQLSRFFNTAQRAVAHRAWFLLLGIMKGPSHDTQNFKVLQMKEEEAFQQEPTLVGLTLISRRNCLQKAKWWHLLHQSGDLGEAAADSSSFCCHGESCRCHWHLLPEQRPVSWDDLCCCQWSHSHCWLLH